jgi:hypothetical protein
MSRSEPGRNSLAGASAEGSGLISARWIGVGAGAKNEARGAAAACVAAGAAALPMAAAKKAFWAAARAVSAAEPAAEVAAGWTGKALGRIGVTVGL